MKYASAKSHSSWIVNTPLYIIKRNLSHNRRIWFILIPLTCHYVVIFWIILSNAFSICGWGECISTKIKKSKKSRYCSFTMVLLKINGGFFFSVSKISERCNLNVFKNWDVIEYRTTSAWLQLTVFIWLHFFQDCGCTYLEKWGKQMQFVVWSPPPLFNINFINMWRGQEPEAKYTDI